MDHDPLFESIRKVPEFAAVRAEAIRRQQAFVAGRGATPPRFEKLVGDLAGACSRRINVKHRLVYQILDEQRTVKVIRMWTHYE